MVKKIVLDGGRYYYKGWKDVDGHGIKVCFTALITLVENGMAKRMNCTIKSGIRMLLTQAGAWARFWGECLYGVCDVPSLATRPWWRKMPEKLLMGGKLSTRNLQLSGSNVWALVPDKTRKAIDAKAKSDALIRCLSKEMFQILFRDAWNVETACHLLVREDVIPTNHWQDVVQVSSNELQESLLNACDKAALECVPDTLGMPVSDLTGKRVACKEDAACGNLIYSSLHLKKRNLNEVYSAEEIEEFGPPPRSLDAIEGHLYASSIQ